MGWTILLAFLVFISFLLISSVKLVIKIDKKVFFSVSFLGIRLFLYDSSVEKTSASKMEKTKIKGKGGFTSFLKRYAKGKTKPELIKELFDIIKILCVRFKKILCHIRFQKVNMNLTVATEDASSTAILYGKFCSVIYPLITLLENTVNFSPEKIFVNTDFNNQEIIFSLNGIIKIRLWFILCFAVSTAFNVFKIRIGDIKNGRT